MQPFEGTPIDTVLNTKATSDLDVSQDLCSKSTASINDLLNDQKKQDNTNEKDEDDQANSQEDTEESDQESLPNQG